MYYFALAFPPQLNDNVNVFVTILLWIQVVG